MNVVRLASLGPGVTQDPQGNVEPGRQVTVLDRSTLLPVALWQDAAATTPLGQPVTTQADGTLPGYVQSPQPILFYDVATGDTIEVDPVAAQDLIDLAAEIAAAISADSWQLVDLAPGVVNIGAESVMVGVDGAGNLQFRGGPIQNESGQPITGTIGSLPAGTPLPSLNKTLPLRKFIKVNASDGSLSISQFDTPWAAGDAIAFEGATVINTAGSAPPPETITFPSPPGDQSYVQGTTIVPLTVQAVDSLGLTVTYSAAGLPVGLSIDAAAGTITGDPTDTPADYTATVTASTGTASNDLTFTITVTAAPVATPAAQFFYLRFGGFNGTTVQNPPYKYLVLQSSDGARVATYKGSHNAQMMCYFDTSSTKPSDQSGAATFAPYGSTPASQKLLDANGKPCFTTYSQGHLMDPGNSAYRSAAVSHGLALINQYGFDGAHADNLIPIVGIGRLQITTLSATLSTGGAISSLPIHALPTADPPAFPILVQGQSIKLAAAGGHTQVWTVTANVSSGATSIPVAPQTPNFAYPSGSTSVSFNVTSYSTSTWITAQFGLLAAIKAGFHANSPPKVLIPNISLYTPDNTYFTGCVDNSDGGFFEPWTDGNAGLAQQVTPTDFVAMYLDYPAYTEAAGKPLLLHSYNNTEAGNTYGLAAMLLTAGTHTYWCTANNNYQGQENWYPEYVTARDSLGGPSGPYTTLGSGLLMRQFANGRVLVNKTPSPITDNALPGTGPSGSTITLAATSGVIRY